LFLFAQGIEISPWSIGRPATQDLYVIAACVRETDQAFSKEAMARNVKLFSLAQRALEEYNDAVVSVRNKYNREPE
jgi:hypothetical protein